MPSFMYYLQDEPGECPDFPNCTQIPKTNSGKVLFRDLQNSWPLKHGYYHFRFRVSDDEFGFIWQDIVNSEEEVPFSEGVIFAKVLRLDKPARPANRLRLKPGNMAPVKQRRQSCTDSTSSSYTDKGTGVGFLKSRLLGSSKDSDEKRHSDQFDATSTLNRIGQRLRAPTNPEPLRRPSDNIATSTLNRIGQRLRAPTNPEPMQPASEQQHSSPPSTDDSNVPSLNISDIVVIHGLRAKPELNDVHAQIHSFDPASQRYVVNVNGDLVKLKEGNLMFLSASSEQLNPLNSPTSSSSFSSNQQPPPPIQVPDLFSFESSSPLHKQTEPSSSSSSSKASEKEDGATRAATVQARYAALRKAQEANGTLEWDPVEERYREKSGHEAVKNEGSGKCGGVHIVGPGQLSDNPEVAAGQQERWEKLKKKQEEAVAELERRKKAEEALAETEAQLKIKLDPKLKLWSEEYGKKKNIRALLGGLDNVLWENSGWKPLSIADIVEDNKVIKKYRLASRVVHPDHTLKLDDEKRFIAKRVFDALTQAVDEFNDNKS